MPCRNREGIGRIHDGRGREEIGRREEELLVRIRVRNDARIVIFAARCGERQHGIEGKRAADLRGVVHEVPGVAFIEGAGRNALRAVDDASAAHRHDEINLFAAAEFNRFPERPDLRVGLNAAELENS